MQELEEAEAQAKRNAGLVHAMTYQEAIAGIFQPPPPDEHATSDLAGARTPQLLFLYPCKNMGI